MRRGNSIFRMFLNMCNGVKHGESSSAVRYVDETSLGCIAYDDNVILLGPNLHVVCQMLLVPKFYFEDCNSGFNASKTQLVPFSKCCSL